MHRRIVLVGLAAALAACADGDRPAPAEPEALAPAFSQGAGQAIPDRYIVQLRDNGPDPLTVALSVGGNVHFVYRDAIRGFAATLPPQAVLALQNNPFVQSIEPDGIMSIVGSGTQNGATWGIDRIDQRSLPLNGTYAYATSGQGVHAYIIDTGILPSHNEFNGRAAIGADYVGDGRNGIDCHGHGTHVAGTIGGQTYGVAQDVALVAVRVLNCSGSGTTSGVIAGVNWVAANGIRPAVANMSLGGGASSTLDNAVANAIASGVTFAIAAGNSNANACNYSPARTPTAITVGATTSSDARASYSNYGSCVDLFAPGSSITSAWIGSNTATHTISGTSMATPHVAGVAALYLEGTPGATPEQVGDAIASAATQNIVTSSNSTNNHLVYNSFATGGGGSGGGTPGPITLTVSGSSTGPWKNAELSWTGATSAVNVKRVSPTTATIATGVTGSSYNDRKVTRSGGSYSYQVCPTSGGACSNTATVIF